jgi:hypothetical protein
VKEDFVAAVVRDDKSIAFLLDDFLDGSRHTSIPPLVTPELISNPGDH